MATPVNKPLKPGLLQSMALGGGAAMFAVNFTHPIELVKTRMQVSGGSLSATFNGVLAKGIGAFWNGIVFAWGREISYTSIKLGAYAPVRDALGASQPDAPIYLKFLAGALTGGTGSVVGNPFDVLKTLAQTNKSETAVPLQEMVMKMYADQGVAGFYRGVEVNIMRACVLNATKMGFYDVSKGYISETTGWSRKDIRTSFCSSFVAGFFMTCTVAPFDMLRTKLMNQPTDKKIYSSLADCAVKTVQQDGVLSLWRGFVPIWARFAPQATLQLLTLEALYNQFGFKSI